MQKRTGIQIQRLELVLVEIAHLAVGALGAVAGQQGQLAHQALEQGGFAGAIAPQQSDPAAGSQGDVDAAEHRALAVAKVCLRELEDGVAGFLGIRKAEGKR